ncbi:MAG: thymidine phosphorylase [Firmicutes bacterium]|nr:thymidine phosphorylase [Bacillota bacterium]
MNMLDIIRKKRDQAELNHEEIRFWIEGYTQGRIPDYQSAAMLMAIYLRGLSKNETVELTLAMRDSGLKLDLSDIEGIKADKHSTGGVGDKTTLIVAPILAAAGLKVAKMSGRSLGFTGGTIDKLESINGFRVGLNRQEFIEQLNHCGVALMGQTAELAPADKLLYALRDATATVESTPLIAASIMSKKLAVGADVLVLDVKYGSGAFFKTIEAANEAAALMVEIGQTAGQKAAAIISSMEQPLGRAVGNALEVAEAWQTLCCQGPDDLRELSLDLAAEAIVLGDLSPDKALARAKAQELLDKGLARAKFIEMVKAQGGDSDFSHLPQAALRIPFTAPKSGYICALHANIVGRAALALGAGRLVKEAIIDHSAGILLQHKVGDYVQEGECIAMLHGNDNNRLQEANALMARSVFIETTAPPNLIS